MMTDYRGDFVIESQDPRHFRVYVEDIWRANLVRGLDSHGSWYVTSAATNMVAALNGRERFTAEEVAAFEVRPQ